MFCHLKMKRESFMLVSHLKKFIFLKTVKTAGTSVEIFFEEFCTATPKLYAPGGEFRPEEKSKFGIVGARGEMANELGPEFYNHIPARELKDKLGSKIWDEYFKFTVCRNPYDALVSQFWFQRRKLNYEMIRQPSQVIHEAFRRWLSEPRDNLNSHIYLIDGIPAVNFFIRYESLEEDVNTVSRILGIDKNLSELQNFKSGIRPRTHDFSSTSEYYDQASIDIVESLYQFELSHLGYSIRDVV